MATALITGASQGIGACIAKRLAKDGYNVAINHFPSDSDKANAEKVAEECRSFGVEAELFAANVADYAQCEAMTKAVKERFGLPTSVLPFQITFFALECIFSGSTVQ